MLQVSDPANFSYRNLWNITPQVLLRFDICKLDHLGPFLGFVGDEFAEVGRRTPKYRAVQVGKPRLDLGISKAGVDLPVEYVDTSYCDWYRRAPHVSGPQKDAHACG